MHGKIMQTKLIALDLDDTLLNSCQQISDENVKALKECADCGIYVVLCSGRAEAAILPFVERLGIGDSEYGRYIIGINGCSIFDMKDQKQIFCKKVASDILVRTNQIALEYGLKTEVYTPDTIYYEEATEWTKLDVDLCKIKGVCVDDYENFIKQGFTKMLVPGDPEKLQKVQSVLKKEFGDRAVIFISKPYFLEILPPGCGKGESIHILSKHIGIDPEQTMGFGDSMNDESLIRLAGTGVVMCNGLEQMKKIADFVTDKSNNESGVADFIYKHVLN